MHSDSRTPRSTRALKVTMSLAASLVALPSIGSAQDLIGGIPNTRTRNFINQSGLDIVDSCPDPEAEECVDLPDYYFEAGLPPVIVPASTYPSSINVPAAAFVTGSKITDVNVRISGISHQSIDDVDVLLVGPNGQSVLLASNVSSGTKEVINLKWKFDDSARLPLPNSSSNEGRASTRPTSPLYNLIYPEWAGVWSDPAERTFKPTDYDVADDPETFPAPAPQGLITPSISVQFPAAPYTAAPTVTGGQKLAVFNGTTPVGEWKLFVTDDLFWYDGSLLSWGLEITAAQ